MEEGCATCRAGANFGGQACDPFGLIEKPGADITAFLQTLTGEIPEVEHPALPNPTAATPLPDGM